MTFSIRTIELDDVGHFVPWVGLQVEAAQSSRLKRFRQWVPISDQWRHHE